MGRTYLESQAEENGLVNSSSEMTFSTHSQQVPPMGPRELKRPSTRGQHSTNRVGHDATKVSEDILDINDVTGMGFDNGENVSSSSKGPTMMQVRLGG